MAKQLFEREQTYTFAHLKQPKRHKHKVNTTAKNKKKWTPKKCWIRSQLARQTLKLNKQKQQKMNTTKTRMHIGIDETTINCLV